MRALFAHISDLASKASQLKIREWRVGQLAKQLGNQIINEKNLNIFLVSNVLAFEDCRVE